MSVDNLKTTEGAAQNVVGLLTPNEQVVLRKMRELFGNELPSYELIEISGFGACYAFSKEFKCVGPQKMSLYELFPIVFRSFNENRLHFLLPAETFGRVLVEYERRRGNRALTLVSKV